MRRSLFAWLLLAACVWAVIGCGGGSTSLTSQGALNSGSSGGSGQGRVTLTVLWPTPTRLIPLASASIRADLMLGSANVGTQLITRPASGNTSTVTFNNVTVGALILSATAFPNADGSGTAQARGSAPVAVTAGATSAVSVTMGSTIAQLSLTPQNPTINIGQTVFLTATARDAAGNIVLLSAPKLQWVSSDTAKATVSSSGTVAGVAAASGATAPQITVTDTESGKSATTTVTVMGSALVYNNAFESGAVDSVWSTVALGASSMPLHVEATPIGNRHFLGQLGQQKAILTLKNLPAHTQITISFDLFIILTWDGNGGQPAGSTVWGPDIWQLQVAGGPTLLNTTFDNWHDNLFPDSPTQAYPNAFPGASHPAQTGAAEANTLGYTFVTLDGKLSDIDSVYRLNYTFVHSGSTLELDFNGLQNESAFEFWGLDNVRVTAQ